jgi:hypothetical protein
MSGLVNKMKKMLVQPPVANVQTIPFSEEQMALLKNNATYHPRRK